MEFLKNIFRSIFGSKPENKPLPEVAEPVTKVEEPPVKENPIMEAPVKVEPVVEVKHEELKNPVVKEEPKSTAKEIKAKIKKPASNPTSTTEGQDKPKPKRKRPNRSKKPKQEGQ
jgi:hypothetical protein